MRSAACSVLAAKLSSADPMLSRTAAAALAAVRGDEGGAWSDASLVCTVSAATAGAPLLLSAEPESRPAVSRLKLREAALAPGVAAPGESWRYANPPARCST